MHYSNNHKSRRKRRRAIAFSLVGAGLLGMLVTLAGAFRSAPPIDPSRLAEVERGDIARSVVATGKVEPRSKVEVKSKASGIVKKILVDYGDRVRAGQVLVELDKEELRARVRGARASLQAAEAARQAARAAHERNKIEAEAPDLPFLKSSADRARRLYEEGLISQAVLEEAEKAYRMALNKKATALRNVAVTKAEVARARAQVAQARATLERAEENLRNSTIVSPMDGVVLSRDVEVGDAVSSILVLGSEATLVMTLGDVNDVYVRGKVDEADIGKVFLGQPARISVESFPDKKFEGEVTKISPMGVEEDNVTTFEVRVSIYNPGGKLKAMMTANTEIILEEKHDVLLIPEGAVIYDAERNTSVEIPDRESETGKREVAVELGISNGIQTEVVEGLNEDQEVILQ